MKPLPRLLGLAALLAAAATVPAAPAPTDTATAFARVCGGIIDPAGKTLYVAGESGNLEALDLEKGKVLWTTKEPMKPLAAAGKRLVVEVAEKGKPNVVRVVVLDCNQEGKKGLESDPITFPDWVSTGLTHGRSYTSSATLDKNDLLLKWQARSFYAGGARPTPEIEKAARREAHGVARVDLKTGKVEMLDDAKAPADATKLPKDVEGEKSREYWTGSDWKTTPIVTGSGFAALVQDGKGGPLSLKRWDAAGKPLETVELMKGKELWPMVSADGRHLLVHQALVKEQLPEGDFAWWVFSLETGKQVAKLPYEGNGEMAVVGDRVFLVVTGQPKGRPRPGMWDQPRTLKVYDIKSGKLAWEHALEPHKMLPPLP
jgi:hypothetical protein